MVTSDRASTSQPRFETEARGHISVAGGVPQADPELAERLRSYQHVRHASFAGFHYHPTKKATSDKLSNSQLLQMNRSVTPRKMNGVNDEVDGMFTVTRFADSSQVHLVKQPLGMREQLTFLNEPIASVAPAPFCSPHTGFVYGADTGGNENTQYFFYDLQLRTTVMLTDGIAKNMSGEWSSCGNYWVYSSNLRDNVHFEVYCVKVQDVIDMKTKFG